MPMRPRLTVTLGNAWGGVSRVDSDSSGSVLTVLASPMPSGYSQQQRKQSVPPANVA